MCCTDMNDLWSTMHCSLQLKCYAPFLFYISFRAKRTIVTHIKWIQLKDIISFPFWNMIRMRLQITSPAEKKKSWAQDSYCTWEVCGGMNCIGKLHRLIFTWNCRRKSSSYMCTHCYCIKWENVQKKLKVNKVTSGKKIKLNSGRFKLNFTE